MSPLVKPGIVEVQFIFSYNVAVIPHRLCDQNCY